MYLFFKNYLFYLNLIIKMKKKIKMSIKKGEKLDKSRFSQIYHSKNFNKILD